MDGLSIDAKTISEGVFVENIGEDSLSAICNWCTQSSPYPGSVFFEGLDTDMTGSTWLQDAAVHLLKYHVK